MGWQWDQLDHMQIIDWTLCKSLIELNRSFRREITTPAPHHSFFNRPYGLPDAQPTVSKHRRHTVAIGTVILSERCWCRHLWRCSAAVTVALFCWQRCTYSTRRGGAYRQCWWLACWYATPWTRTSTGISEQSWTCWWMNTGSSASYAYCKVCTVCTVAPPSIQ